MKTDEKALKRQKSYEDRQRAKGLVRCIVWVPEEKKEILIHHAEHLRGSKT